MKDLGLASWLLLPLLLVGFIACGDDDDPMGTTPTPDLTFTGDASFQNAHGGQTIHVGVKDAAGTLVASDVGTVSSTADPSFSFTFTDALEEGATYDLEYWIDSNFGDTGTQGECDAPDVDHQWRIDVGAATTDVTIDDTHRPTETEDICGSTNGGGDGPGY